MPKIHSSETTPHSRANANNSGSSNTLNSTLTDFQDNRHETILQRELRDLVFNQPKSASMVTQQVAQFAIAGINHLTPDVINQLANAYNLLGQETPLSVRINSLSGVEHAVYTWLIQNKAPDLTGNNIAQHVRGLMDATKTERHAIVSQSINAGDHQQADRDLPIAGFNLLSNETKLEVRAMWRGLIEKTGQIRITDTNPDNAEVHNGFDLKILTEFSRLLEGQYGREMVKNINTSDKLITIEPFHYGHEGKDLAAGQVNQDEIGINLVKLDVEPAQEQLVNYPQHNITAFNETQRITFFNELKPTQQHQAGVSILDGGDTTYYKFGTGSNVKVTVPVELTDSSMYNDSRLADTNDDELATPVFVLLGHELGHGIHMQRGTATQKTNIPNFFTNQHDQEKYGSDSEEYVNIEGTENSLRAEHGLGARKGHGNIPLILRTQMRGQMNNWFSWLDRLGATIKALPVFIQIDQLLTTINNRITAEWSNPLLFPQLRIDFAALPGEIKQLQRNFLNTNFIPLGLAEIKDLSTRLEQINFSFNWSNDRTRIVNYFIERLNTEGRELENAVQQNTLPVYLSTLGAGRLLFMNQKKGFVINRLTQQSNNNVNDLNALASVQDSILRFTNAEWIFT